jgi:predicted Rossmann fold flavoprotein
MDEKRVAVIGGGPAGMMAAICSAKNGHDVTLYEKNEKLGKKLFLTGKGRCNITNNADISGFFSNIPRNSKFLYSALYAFPNYDLIEFLEANGLKTKVERGERVFPVSDKSSDVIKAFQKSLKDNKVKVLLNTNIKNIEKQDKKFIITAKNTEHKFDAAIIATGGLSYPSTGSDGKFFNIVKSLGHTTTKFEPSLVSLITDDFSIRPVGLTLKNISAKFYNSGKLIHSDFGELLFTHWGISGPLVLSASAHYYSDNMDDAYVVLDLKSALNEQKLENRILSDINLNSNKDFSNFIRGYLPSSMVPHFIDRLNFNGEIKCNMITKENRKEIIYLLKNYRLDITAKRGISEAIITRGGISTKEINPSTMESKIIPELYFAGEMIDVDAFTGGYNLQIAFSTGYLAGLSV